MDNARLCGEFRATERVPMLHSLLGFAGSKAAVLLAAGAITVGAVGVGEATGSLPRIPNDHSRLVSSTETATATGTPAGTTLSVAATPEGDDGEHGKCNAVKRGSEQGQANKAEAPAFQNLDCPTPTQTITPTSATVTPTSTSTSHGKSDEEHGNRGEQAPLTASATGTPTAATGTQNGPNEHANSNSAQ
jgi:hypothetical protein